MITFFQKTYIIEITLSINEMITFRYEEPQFKFWLREASTFGVQHTLNKVTSGGENIRKKIWLNLSNLI